MKPFHTLIVSITLAVGLLAPVLSLAFSFGSFNFGDSWGDNRGDHWGDGWHNNWGDHWQTCPRWGDYPPPR